MKKLLYSLTAFLFFLQAGAQTATESSVPVSTKILPQDSIQENIVEEDEAIEDIIQARKAPQKEKVAYISQLTKYGFKNLFSKYSYNPSMPYSSQVNPYEESYMQDYLRAHSNSLVKMKGWGMPYFNLIDNIFSQYGLPKELKYLAVIESNLNSGATSWRAMAIYAVHST
jgi:hypothetical protein